MESNVNGSILGTIKKMLGLVDEIEEFDLDIIVLINTAFNTLTQLGVGPIQGYLISSKQDSWSDFIGNDPRFEMVKTYVFLKVKTVFDPPVSSFILEAYKEQIKELEWRLNIQVDPEETFNE